MSQPMQPRMPENEMPGLPPAGAAERGGFEPTQWSMVLAAVHGSGERPCEALEQLCRAYWPPVYAHLRGKGHGHEESMDLTQEFFARMLQGASLGGANPDKGRFRAFLLGAVNHFLINEWKKSKAQKRGGGLVFVDLDGLSPGMRDAFEPRSGDDPEQAYDRQWALTLLERVRERIRREHEAVGQGERYRSLKVYLTDDGHPRTYAETAGMLGISEAAVKSAVYKLRQRFGELLRAEVARTVGTMEEVEDELRHLIAALRGG